MALPSIFAEFVSCAMGLGLSNVFDNLPRTRRVSIATMCSGTEAPIFALEMIREELADKGMNLVIEHLFSAEIVPFKQAFIERNFRPEIIFRDITELSQGSGFVSTTSYFLV